MIHKAKNNEAGFSAIEAGLILIIIALIAFVGWFVWHSKQTADKNLTSTTSAASSSKAKTQAAPTTKTKINSYAGWKSYTSPDGMSFKYPASWNFSATNGSFELKSPVNDNLQFSFGYDRLSSPSTAYSSDTVVSNLPLGSTAAKPLYLLTLDFKNSSGSDIDALAVTDVNAAKGTTNVSLEAGFASPTGRGTLIFYAILGPPYAQNNGGETLATYQSESDYQNVIKVFQSISF